MKIVVQNLATEYMDEGKGGTMLFLHGWQHTLRSFDAITPFLAEGYRVVRLDLPGFGGTDLSRGDWNLGRYVSFVADFVKKMGLDLYALVGHSFGGRIVVAGTARNVFRSKKIVLIDSSGLERRKHLQLLFWKILAKVGKIFIYTTPLFFWRRYLKMKLYDLIGSRDYPNAGILKKAFLAIIKENLSEDAKKISVPTLIIWGENDRTTPISEGQKFARLIKNSKLEILMGCGHFVHQEKPKEVAELVKKFL